MRHRFSLRWLLSLVAICGIGFAALRTPSALWANALFTAALAALTLAPVCVVYGRGQGRAFWAGFAVCGWVYFAAALGPWLGETVGPRLVTTALIDILYPMVSPPPPTTARARPHGSTVALTLDEQMKLRERLDDMRRLVRSPSDPAYLALKRRVDQFSSAPSDPRADWTEPDRGTGVGVRIGQVALVSPEPFRRIGHSLLTLLIGILGGVFARFRYAALARAEERTGEPAGATTDLSDSVR
jgi:hypothetical protein